MNLMKTTKIDIKPLSVNEAWKGRRYRTDKYKFYKREVLLKLKPLKIPEGKLHIDIEFGFSNTGSDIDNPIKAFLDCLQAKYKFNDSRIYSMYVNKLKTAKKEEYIKFKITEYEPI